MNEDGFLRSIVEDPANAAVTWLVLADWLEEQGDPRAELVRLSRDPRYRPELSPAQRAEWMGALLASGIRPCVPQASNFVGMTFAWIATGTFRMGGNKDNNEQPTHKVTLTKGFYLGIHPITQAQWQAVMGRNPSRFRGEDRPVECVSWDDCQEFCHKLSRLTKQPVRLPTEAEWEYACRAGTTTEYHSGNTEAALKQVGWYHGNSNHQTQPVGGLAPNPWGLYDMHGNVYEWCNDWHGDYGPDSIKDPKGAITGNGRVCRGATRSSYAVNCRAAYRYWGPPTRRSNYVGCRVCFCLD